MSSVDTLYTYAGTSNEAVAVALVLKRAADHLYDYAEQNNFLIEDPIWEAIDLLDTKCEDMGFYYDDFKAVSRPEGSLPRLQVGP